MNEVANRTIQMLCYKLTAARLHYPHCHMSLHFHSTGTAVRFISELSFSSSTCRETIDIVYCCRQLPQYVG